MGIEWIYGFGLAEGYQQLADVSGIREDTGHLKAVTTCFALVKGDADISATLIGRKAV